MRDSFTPQSLLDVDSLAVRLGVGPRFVRRLVDERRIPFLKIGRFVRFDPDEVDLWIEGTRVAAVDRRVHGRPH